MRRFPRARARHLRNRSAAAAAGSAAGAEEKKRKTPIEPAVTPTPIGAWQSIGRRRPERTAAGSRRGTSADTAHPLRPRTCLRVCACVCVCVCVCVHRTVAKQASLCALRVAISVKLAAKYLLWHRQRRSWPQRGALPQRRRRVSSLLFDRSLCHHVETMRLRKIKWPKKFRSSPWVGLGYVR